MHLRMARGRTPPLTIGGTPLTFATQATAYAGFTVTATGGSGGNVFSLAPTSGALPAGMTIDASTGSPTGTPTGTGTSTNIIIRVTDNFGHTADLAAFSIAVSAASPGLVITDPVQNRSPYTAYAPVFRDAFVAMTPLVDQDDEAIDVQSVCGVPYSPMATSITLSGTDLTWFDKIAGGKLVFKAASRASVPRNGYLTLTVNASNANGASEQSALKVWVPADADCRFVSFGSGLESNNGTSKTAPWKYCPGTVDSTSGASTFTTAKTIFFDGSVRHETSLIQSYSAPFAAPDNHGGTGTPVRYAFTGWKGQAKFTGAKTEAGSWTAASSGDCYASPDLANITVMTASTAVARHQMVCWGDVMGRVAQYPRPNILSKNEDPQLAADGGNNYNDTTGTADGGMKRLIVSSSNTNPASVYLYASPDGTANFIQDPKLDARFNNASVAYNAAGIGQWLKIWDSGNNVSYVNVLSYDVTTHRATFSFGGTSGTGAYKTSSGYSAYALMNSPYDVQVANQYAVTGGTKVIAHRPASAGQCYISRLTIGAGLGHAANVVYHQPWFERYSGAAGGQGLAFSMYNSQNNAGVCVYGARIHQNNSELEDPVGLYGYGATGIDNPIFDRFHFSENVRGRGSVVSGSCLVAGKLTGTGPGSLPTKAEVAAHPTGKVRWWWAEEDSVSRSLWFWTQFRGIEFRERVATNFSTVHGDGDAWYLESPGRYGDHSWVHGDFADNCLRWKTSSFDGSYLSSSLSNWYDGNVVLGAVVGTNVGMSLFSGDPGGLYTSCIFMQSSNSSDSNNYPCMALNGGFANATLQYCVMNGVTTNTTPLFGVATNWTIDHCGNTKSGGFPANDAANSRYVTNTTSLSARQKWDGLTMDSGWASILQAGQTPGTVKIGPFSNWTV